MRDVLSRYLKAALIQNLDICSSTAWRPLADIYQRGLDWFVKVELAGVNPNDLTLCASGNRLTLKGIRRDKTMYIDHTSQTMEIAYNRFERVFEFSTNIEQANVLTEYKDGMLYITLYLGNQP